MLGVYRVFRAILYSSLSLWTLEVWLLTWNAMAQIQLGTVLGTVLDPSGAALPGASIALLQPISGSRRTTLADRAGQFVFHQVPFGRYRMIVQAPGFQLLEKVVSIRSNLPVSLQLKLRIYGSAETVTVEETLLEHDRASTSTIVDERLIGRRAGARPSAALQELVATVPGWATEDNGLLHFRGVDDGFLFITDGIPLTDRIDPLFAGSLDAQSIQSLRVISGHFPAEYGGASGGVINLVSKSAMDRPLRADLSLAGGNFRTGEVSAAVRGNIQQKLGLSVAGSLGGSLGRYLDPIDPQNFNNRGGSARISVRADWHATSRDVLIANLWVNGTEFRVTNTLEQELNGQRQRQELRDNSQSLTWHRNWSPNTVTDVAWYRRSFRSRLFPSPGDIPLSATQDRQHVRHGLLVNVTHSFESHLFQAGVEAQRVAPREFLSFHVTDEETGLEAGLSPAALEFDAENPFVFSDRVVRANASWYVQDTFSPLQNLRVNAGLRFDHTSLLVSDSQFSPRVGIVYYVPKTRTSVRGSYNRLFAPPQVENLLLSSSEQARELSPFDTAEGEGGAEVRPEKQHGFEVGFAQDVARIFKLDVSYWWRSVRNYADPNVFFGTTIVFPNAVARGNAKGLDVRLDVPERKGWSGFLSYGNSNVFQIGPINGGLFLEDEVIEIGPGTRFVPDHDQRNVGAFGVTYSHDKTGLRVSLFGRHESGTPLQVEADDLDELKERPGADLVNFERGRVRPRTLFDASIGRDLLRRDDLTVRLQVNVRNLTDRRFAYNFGNPFSGTHFGHPRLWSLRLRMFFW